MGMLGRDGKGVFLSTVWKTQKNSVQTGVRGRGVPHATAQAGALDRGQSSWRRRWPMATIATRSQRP